MADQNQIRKNATKLLAVKMLQGYKTIGEKCTRCNVPLMEFRGTTKCVVCSNGGKSKGKAATQIRTIVADSPDDDSSFRPGVEVIATSVKPAPKDEERDEVMSTASGRCSSSSGKEIMRTMSGSVVVKKQPGTRGVAAEKRIRSSSLARLSSRSRPSSRSRSRTRSSSRTRSASVAPTRRSKTDETPIKQDEQCKSHPTQPKNLLFLQTIQKMAAQAKKIAEAGESREGPPPGSHETSEGNNLQEEKINHDEVSVAQSDENTGGSPTQGKQNPNENESNKQIVITNEQQRHVNDLTVPPSPKILEATTKDTYESFPLDECSPRNGNITAKKPPSEDTRSANMVENETSPPDIAINAVNDLSVSSVPVEADQTFEKKGKLGGIPLSVPHEKGTAVSESHSQMGSVSPVPSGQPERLVGQPPTVNIQDDSRVTENSKSDSLTTHDNSYEVTYVQENNAKSSSQAEGFLKEAVRVVDYDNPTEHVKRNVDTKDQLVSRPEVNGAFQTPVVTVANKTTSRNSVNDDVFLCELKLKAMQSKRKANDRFERWLSPPTKSTEEKHDSTSMHNATNPEENGLAQGPETNQRLGMPVELSSVQVPVNDDSNVQITMSTQAGGEIVHSDPRAQREIKTNVAHKNYPLRSNVQNWRAAIVKQMNNGRQIHVKGNVEPVIPFDERKELANKFIKEFKQPQPFDETKPKNLPILHDNLHEQSQPRRPAEAWPSEEKEYQEDQTLPSQMNNIDLPMTCFGEEASASENFSSESYLGEEQSSSSEVCEAVEDDVTELSRHSEQDTEYDQHVPPPPPSAPPPLIDQVDLIDQLPTVSSSKDDSTTESLPIPEDQVNSNEDVDTLHNEQELANDLSVDEANSCKLDSSTTAKELLVVPNDHLEVDTTHLNEASKPSERNVEHTSLCDSDSIFDCGGSNAGSHASFSKKGKVFTEKAPVSTMKASRNRLPYFYQQDKEVTSVKSAPNLRIDGTEFCGDDDPELRRSGIKTKIGLITPLNLPQEPRPKITSKNNHDSPNQGDETERYLSSRISEQYEEDILSTFEAENIPLDHGECQQSLVSGISKLTKDDDFSYHDGKSTLHSCERSVHSGKSGDSKLTKEVQSHDKNTSSVTSAVSKRVKSVDMSNHGDKSVLSAVSGHSQLTKDDDFSYLKDGSVRSFLSRTSKSTIEDDLSHSDNKGTPNSSGSTMRSATSAQSNLTEKNKFSVHEDYHDKKTHPACNRHTEALAVQTEDEKTMNSVSNGASNITKREHRSVSLTRGRSTDPASVSASDLTNREHRSASLNRDRPSDPSSGSVNLTKGRSTDPALVSASNNCNDGNESINNGSSRRHLEKQSKSSMGRGNMRSDKASVSRGSRRQANEDADIVSELGITEIRLTIPEGRMRDRSLASACDETLASLSSKVEKQTQRIARLEAEALRKHEEAERAATRARVALEKMIKARSAIEKNSNIGVPTSNTKDDFGDLSMCSTLSEKSIFEMNSAKRSLSSYRRSERRKNILVTLEADETSDRSTFVSATNTNKSCASKRLNKSVTSSATGNSPLSVGCHVSKHLRKNSLSDVDVSSIRSRSVASSIRSTTRKSLPRYDGIEADTMSYKSGTSLSVVSNRSKVESRDLSINSETTSVKSKSVTSLTASSGRTSTTNSYISPYGIGSVKSASVTSIRSNGGYSSAEGTKTENRTMDSNSTCFAPSFASFAASTVVSSEGKLSTTDLKLSNSDVDINSMKSGNVVSLPPSVASSSSNVRSKRRSLTKVVKSYLEMDGTKSNLTGSVTPSIASTPSTSSRPQCEQSTSDEMSDGYDASNATSKPRSANSSFVSIVGSDTRQTNSISYSLDTLNLKEETATSLASVGGDSATRSKSDLRQDQGSSAPSYNASVGGGSTTTGTFSIKSISIQSPTIFEDAKSQTESVKSECEVESVCAPTGSIPAERTVDNSAADIIQRATLPSEIVDAEHDSTASSSSIRSKLATKPIVYHRKETSEQIASHENATVVNQREDKSRTFNPTTDSTSLHPQPDAKTSMAPPHDADLSSQASSRASSSNMVVSKNGKSNFTRIKSGSVTSSETSKTSKTAKCSNDDDAATARSSSDSKASCSPSTSSSIKSGSVSRSRSLSKTTSTMEKSHSSLTSVAISDVSDESIGSNSSNRSTLHSVSTSVSERRTCSASSIPCGDDRTSSATPKKVLESDHEAYVTPNVSTALSQAETNRDSPDTLQPVNHPNPLPDQNPKAASNDASSNHWRKGIKSAEISNQPSVGHREVTGITKTPEVSPPVETDGPNKDLDIEITRTISNDSYGKLKDQMARLANYTSAVNKELQNSPRESRVMKEILTSPKSNTRPNLLLPYSPRHGATIGAAKTSHNHPKGILSPESTPKSSRTSFWTEPEEADQPVTKSLSNPRSMRVTTNASSERAKVTPEHFVGNVKTSKSAKWLSLNDNTYDRPARNSKYSDTRKNYCHHESVKERRSSVSNVNTSHRKHVTFREYGSEIES